MEKGQEHIHPELLGLIEQSKDEGVFIDQLKKGDVITIETKNHTYSMRVIDPDPKRRLVEVTSNGKYFKEPTIIPFNGSSLTGTGTMVKLGWAAVGYRLYLGNAFLSSAKSILINNVDINTKSESSV